MTTSSRSSPGAKSAGSKSGAGSAKAPPPALEALLSHRLHALYKLSDAFGSGSGLRASGVAPGDARCLAAIGAFEPLSVVELAARARLNKAQASRAAQSLADQGLVKKQANKADARGVVLTLTGTGRTAWRRVMSLIERHNEQVFGVLSPPERKQFEKLLERLLTHHGAAE